MIRIRKKHRREKRVVLFGFPPGFLDDLPRKDQQAISKMTGRGIKLLGYDADGRAKLEFTERDSTIHSLYVKPDFIA